MNNFIVILTTLIISFVLTIVTFPLGSFAPDWTQLFLIYWVLALPATIGLSLSWIIGLLVDVFVGSTLGINAMIFTMITYLVFKIHHITRYITIFQQSIVMFIIILLKVTLILWIDSILDLENYNTSLYWSCLTSSMLWPVVFYFLRWVRRKYDVIE